MQKQQNAVSAVVDSQSPVSVKTRVKSALEKAQEASRPADAKKIDEASHILLSAAANLEKYGWIRHTYGNVTIGFCAIGALHHAYRQLETDPDDPLSAHLRAYYSAHERLTDHLNHLGHGSNIADWNDEIVNDKKEVIDTFRMVAYK